MAASEGCGSNHPYKRHPHISAPIRERLWNHCCPVPHDEGGLEDMVPPWMIEDRERQRRETEHHDWPELRIELPVHGYDEPSRRRPTPSAPIVIDVFGGA